MTKNDVSPKARMGKPRLDTSDLSPCFSELTGADLPGIIVMARAAYWSPTRHAERRGKRWIAKDQRLWSRETSLTERQIKDTFIRLRRLGLIETKQYLFGPVGKERSITHLRLTTKAIHAIIAFDPAWANLLKKNYGGDVKMSTAPKGGDGKLSTGVDGNPSTPPPSGNGNPATQGDGNPATLKQARKNKLESKKVSEKVQSAASGEESPSQNSFSKQEGSAEGNLKGKIKTQIYTEENRTDDAVKAWEKYSAIKAELTKKDLGLIKNIVLRMGDYNTPLRTPANVLMYVCCNWDDFWTYANAKETAFPPCAFPTLSFVHRYLTSAIHFTPKDEKMAIIIADIGIEPVSNYEHLKGEAFYVADQKYDNWLVAYWDHPLTGDPPPDEDPGIEAVTDAEIETAIDKQMKAVQAEM